MAWEIWVILLIPFLLLGSCLNGDVLPPGHPGDTRFVDRRHIEGVP